MILQILYEKQILSDVYFTMFPQLDLTLSSLIVSKDHKLDTLTQCEKEFISFESCNIIMVILYRGLPSSWN